MTHINQALGDEIIAGGLAMISEDEKVYGEATAVVIAQGKMFEKIQDIATKAGADHSRLMLANRMGDLIVSVLHGGDMSKVLQRVIAETARIAPIVDLQARKASREKATDVERSFAAALDGFGEDGAASGTLGMAAE